MSDDLLTMTRVVVEPAPVRVLKRRLQRRLADKDWRLQRRTKWPACISDEWLQDEIDTLQRAIAEAPGDGQSELFDSTANSEDQHGKTL